MTHESLKLSDGNRVTVGDIVAVPGHGIGMVLGLTKSWGRKVADIDFRDGDRRTVPVYEIANVVPE